MSPCQFSQWAMSQITCIQSTCRLKLSVCCEKKDGKYNSISDVFLIFCDIIFVRRSYKLFQLPVLMSQILVWIYSVTRYCRYYRSLHISS